VEKEICTLKGEAVNLLSSEEKEERNHFPMRRDNFQILKESLLTNFLSEKKNIITQKGEESNYSFQ
jgi:hypothetical protein